MQQREAVDRVVGPEGVFFGVVMAEVVAGERGPGSLQMVVLPADELLARGAGLLPEGRVCRAFVLRGDRLADELVACLGRFRCLWSRRV